MKYQKRNVKKRNPLKIAPKKKKKKDLPGGKVVKNLPAKVGDMGLIPGLGGFHMPWSN